MLNASPQIVVEHRPLDLPARFSLVDGIRGTCHREQHPCGPTRLGVMGRADPGKPVGRETPRSYSTIPPMSPWPHRYIVTCPRFGVAGAISGLPSRAKSMLNASPQIAWSVVPPVERQPLQFIADNRRHVHGERHCANSAGRHHRRRRGRRWSGQRWRSRGCCSTARGVPKGCTQVWPFRHLASSCESGVSSSGLPHDPFRHVSRFCRCAARRHELCRDKSHCDGITDGGPLAEGVRTDHNPELLERRACLRGAASTGRCRVQHRDDRRARLPASRPVGSSAPSLGQRSAADRA